MKKRVLAFMTIALLGMSNMSLAVAADAVLPEANVGDGATPDGFDGTDDGLLTFHEEDVDAIGASTAGSANMPHSSAGDASARDN